MVHSAGTAGIATVTPGWATCCTGRLRGWSWVAKRDCLRSISSMATCNRLRSVSAVSSCFQACQNSGSRFSLTYVAAWSVSWLCQEANFSSGVVAALIWQWETTLMICTSKSACCKTVAILCHTPEWARLGCTLPPRSNFRTREPRFDSCTKFWLSGSSLQPTAKHEKLPSFQP